MKKTFAVFALLLLILISGCGTSRESFISDGDDLYNAALESKRTSEIFYGNLTAELDPSTSKQIQEISETEYHNYQSLLNSSLTSYYQAVFSEISNEDSLLYNSSFCWACTENAILNKDYGLAIKCHEGRLRLFPNNLYSYDWLINLYTYAGEFDKGIMVAEGMLERIPFQNQEKKYESSFPLSWLIFLSNKVKNYNASGKNES